MRAGSSPLRRDVRRIGPTIRSICAGSLLVVTAIQGITPALDDLASERMFHLLLQGVPSSEPKRDSEDRAGVVSDSMLTARGLATQRRVELGRAAGFVSRGPILEPIVKKVARAQDRRGSPIGPDRLIHLLCHLVC